MEEVVKKIIKKEFGTENFKFKEVSDMGSLDVLVIQIKNKKYVLKLLQDKKQKDSLDNNIFALKKLKGFNVAPELISSGKMDGIPYSIESFLKGKKKETMENFAPLLDCLKKVHTIKRAKCGQIFEKEENWKNYVKKNFILKYKDRFEKRFGMDGDIINYLLKNIPLGKEFSLIHGDFDFGNFFVFKKTCFLFDFEDCFFGEKEYDLGLYYYQRSHSMKNPEKILKIEGYDKHKILYYSLCVGVKKVALSKDNKLSKQIWKLKRILGEMNIS